MKALRQTLCTLAVGLLLSSDLSHAAETIMDAKVLAPLGRLRAAINLGNPVLAGRDVNGAPTGITVDIARELGRRFGLPVDLVIFDQAGQVSDAAGADRWDVAFLAIDPKRAEEIAFTAPYVLIEGAFAVPASSPVTAVAEVDRDGMRIAVIEKSAYDLFLTRTLKHATLVRAANDAATTAKFLAAKLDVLAGVRQPLSVIVARHAGLRMVPGRFMAIEQAMGVPVARAAIMPSLRAFVEDLKVSGFIEDALRRHRRPDAQVAPRDTKS